jgi:hypothetical protein
MTLNSKWRNDEVITALPEFTKPTGQVRSTGILLCAPVRRVQGVEVHVNRDPTRTSDAGNYHDIVFLDSGAVDPPDQRTEQDAVAAPGAPDMREFFVVPKVLVSQLCDISHFVLYPPATF